jgi:hypothetical protein
MIRNGASRQLQREAMAKCGDGVALGHRGIMKVAKGFCRLKACKHLPVLRVVLAAHQFKYLKYSS